MLKCLASIISSTVDEIMLFIYIYTYIHRLSVDGIMLSRYFSRHTQTLGVLEVDSSALISKTVSAQMDDADMKRKERAHTETLAGRAIQQRRGGGVNEAVGASNQAQTRSSFAHRGREFVEGLSHTT